MARSVASSLCVDGVKSSTCSDENRLACVCSVRMVSWSLVWRERTIRESLAHAVKTGTQDAAY